MTTPAFYGREAELEWLRRLWDEATERDRDGRFIGGPRIAAVIAETGLGKSRLVQAFYQRLADDPAWDPPERGYWPDSLSPDDVRLHLNPVFDGHVPGGPPRFLWLGARWQPPDARNVEERMCVLPALHEALTTHVRVAQSHRAAWQRLRRATEQEIRSDGLAEAVGQAVDLVGIPLGGLIVKALKIGASVWEAPLTTDSAIRASQADVASALLADLREVFGGFGGGGLVLPVVLWLDDAHWIDPVTLTFLWQAWAEASERRWPLLVVVTHWEREWNELAASGDAHTFVALASDAEGGACLLGRAPLDDLAARLTASLPGLSAAQRALMLEKAGGNFLTLVENIGVLVRQPANFVERRLDGALTPAGEHRVATWESLRHRRLEQRFAEMDPNLQEVLGWSSRAGVQFPLDAVGVFAARRQATSLDHARGLLDSCVKPFAVLDAPAPNLLEFRDRAFHSVAAGYFRSYLAATDEAELVATVRDFLAAWVDGTFDPQGDVVTSATASSESDDQLGNLGTDEVRAVLDVAMRALPLPDEPDWEDSRHRSALRAVLVHLDTAALDGLWPLVRERSARLAGVDWTQVPATVASTAFLTGIARALLIGGQSRIAVAILESRAPAPDASEHSEAMVEALSLLAIGHVDKGDPAAAEPVAMRVLELVERAERSDALDVARSLNLVARVHLALGRPAEASASLTRAVALLEATSGPEDPSLDPVLGNLGATLELLGHHAEAEVVLRRALALDDADAGGLGAASKLNTLGIVLGSLSRYEEAEAAFREVLAIQERDLGPGHPTLATTLNNLATTLRNQGDESGAEDLLIRALAISEAAHGAEHPEVATALSNLADLYFAADDKARAAAFATRAMAIRESLLPADHPDLAVSLNNQAEMLRTAGMLDEAEPLFVRAVAIMEQAFGRAHPDLAVVLFSLGLLREAQDRVAEAEKLIIRANAIAEAALGSASLQLARQLTHLGLLYRRSARNADAYPVLTRALAIRERDEGATGPYVVELLEHLLLTAIAIRRWDEAEQHFARLCAAFEADPPAAGPAMADLLDLGAVLYRASGAEATAVGLETRAAGIRRLA